MAIEYALTLPCPTSGPLPTALGLGAWFKNTVCLIHQNQAWITHCAGDLDQAEACERLAYNVQQLLAQSPYPLQTLAHDLHPNFYSSRYGVQLASEHQIPALAVQHHHAHIAAVCAEHGEDGSDGPLLGLALDGVGLGSDGLAWGGELLQVCGASFMRLGHLSHLPLPGADKAAREPWRMAAAVLFTAGRGEEIMHRFTEQKGASLLVTQLQRGLNCPQTSSMGRVFDAAAGLLGMCPVMAFEAEAAIQLENAASAWIAEQGWPLPLPAGYHIEDCIEDHNNQLTLNLQNGLLALADWSTIYPNSNRSIEEAAAAFHATLIEGLTEWVCIAAKRQGINKIALAGGCFFNRLLSTRLVQKLESHGLTVLTLKTLSPGDMSISLGQAWVAALSLLSEQESAECV